MIDNIKSVKLGSVPYKIVRGHPVVSNEDDKVLWGEFLQGQQVIKVDSELRPEMQRVVLLHEVIHGLLMHCGLSDHLEEIPERLGYALDAFLIGNPEFVRLYATSPFEKLEGIVTSDGRTVLSIPCDTHTTMPDRWPSEWLGDKKADET